jgi:hypothetical protein
MTEAAWQVGVHPASYYTAHREFPEQEPHSCTGQFNIQGRFHHQTDNSHLSNASPPSPPEGRSTKPK